MLTFPCIPPRVAPMERVQMQLQPILLIALIIQLIIQGDFSCLNECKYLNERIAVQILARRACSRARGRAPARKVGVQYWMFRKASVLTGEGLWLDDWNFAPATDLCSFHQRTTVSERAKAQDRRTRAGGDGDMRRSALSYPEPHQPWCGCLLRGRVRPLPSSVSTIFDFVGDCTYFIITSVKLK